MIIIITITTTNDSQISLLYKILKNNVERIKTIINVITLETIKIIVNIPMLSVGMKEKWKKYKKEI